VLKKYKFTIAFIGWMGFVAFSSLYSFKDTDPPNFEIPHLDKVAHFIFYFVACVLGVFFLRERSRESISLLKAVFYMIIFTIVFGLIIEILQHNLTLTRQGDIFDALANSIGSILGAIFARWWFKKSVRVQW